MWLIFVIHIVLIILLLVVVVLNKMYIIEDINATSILIFASLLLSIGLALPVAKGLYTKQQLSKMYFEE